MKYGGQRRIRRPSLRPRPEASALPRTLHPRSLRVGHSSANRMLLLSHPADSLRIPCYLLFLSLYGGQRRIRTFVGASHQIYSLTPLATRVSAHFCSIFDFLFSALTLSHTGYVLLYPRLLILFPLYLSPQDLPRGHVYKRQ